MSTSAQLSANRVIASKGQSVTITRQASGSYDPATGSASITPSTQNAKGVILPFSTGLRKMAGSNIPATDKQCLISPIAVLGADLIAPMVDDTLTDASGQVYKIVEVNPLAPDGTNVLFDLTVRGSK